MDYKKCLTDDELSNVMGGTNFTKILRACDETDTNTFFSLYDEIKEFINTKFDHPRFYKMFACIYIISYLRKCRFATKCNRRLTN